MKHEVELGLSKLRSQGKFQIDLSSNAAKFVKKLENGARFRYYESSYESDELDLTQLDRTVWELRRYCQPLDYDSEVDGHKINQLAINLARIRAALHAGEKGTCITSGWLEKILEEPNHSARESLIWQNLYFGRNRRLKIKIQAYHEFGNSPLFLRPEIVDEVAKYIYLPTEVKAAYRELLAGRQAGEV